MSDKPTTTDPTIVTYNPDGSVTIPISDDTFARIEVMRQPGETDNDVLRRVMEKGMKDSIIGRDGGHRARALKGRR